MCPVLEPTSYSGDIRRLALMRIDNCVSGASGNEVSIVEVENQLEVEGFCSFSAVPHSES